MSGRLEAAGQLRDLLVLDVVGSLLSRIGDRDALDLAQKLAARLRGLIDDEQAAAALVGPLGKENTR